MPLHNPPYVPKNSLFAMFDDVIDSGAKNGELNPSDTYTKVFDLSKQVLLSTDAIEIEVWGYSTGGTGAGGSGDCSITLHDATGNHVCDIGITQGGTTKGNPCLWNYKAVVAQDKFFGQAFSVSAVAATAQDISQSKTLPTVQMNTADSITLAFRNNGGAGSVFAIRHISIKQLNAG